MKVSLNLKVLLSGLGMMFVIGTACKSETAKPPAPIAVATPTAAVTETPAPLATETPKQGEAEPMKPTTQPSPTPTTIKEKAVIETTLGTIELEFFLDIAPGHVENFKKLAKSGFYDSTTFHRVIPGFMIQGGDPNSKDEDRSNDGTGGPGYTIKAEFSNRPHERGTLSMARSMDPNSAGSQFFICVGKTQQLDGKYTVFGQVIKGIEVVDKIVAVPRDGRDNPLKKVEMKKVKIVPMS
jgi:peptidyl-prolyl cis-trans isomerase B (cyclophilin B)